MKKVGALLFFVFQLFGLDVSSQETYRNWTVKTVQKTERIALIIANNHYQNNGKLLKPIPTAKKLESALIEQGFDVLVGRDLGRKAMHDIVSEFSGKYEDYKLAMIFYMGHGFEINGENYLIPIDANPKSSADVDSQSMNLDFIFKKVKNTEIPKVLVLDACRENPYAANWYSSDRAATSDGFTSIEYSTDHKNAEVFYSTQKNSRVNDDNPYLDYFIEEMNNGLCLDEIARKVSKRVDEYDKYQIPGTYGQLLDNICFRKISNSASGDHQDIENDDWTFIDTMTLEALYQEGEDEYSEDNFEQAFSIFEQAANFDYPPAQDKIGYMLQKGIGGNIDLEAAASWYQKAADQGYAPSQNSLGFMYRHGYIGSYKDYEKGFYWFSKASEQDYAPALNNLGSMYKKGVGVDLDYEKAYHLYESAANQGSAVGQNNLASMYFYGYYVERNELKALEWYKKSANQGNGMAQYYLGKIYDNEKIELRDREAAIYWFEQACLNGISEACQIQID